MIGACTWEVSYEACADAQVDMMTPAQKARFEEMAIDHLWNWTRRRFGQCPVVARPCTQDCGGRTSTFVGFGPPTTGSSSGGLLWAPVWTGSSWRPLSCGACTSEVCTCGDGSRVLALPGPVGEVTSVRIDGEVLVADTDYRAVDNKLVRLGADPWPTCQDVYAPATEEGTFEVVFTLGTPVPMGGQVAAGILALEFYKASCSDTTCALPKRLQNITRQGVTVTLIDNFENLEKGQTGIWLIDSWVASVVHTPNPPGRVYSPDIPRRGRMFSAPAP